MKGRLATPIFAAIAVLTVTLSTAACQFSFSFERIEAPLGTVGEIGVRVQKEHNNCTLPSMDDYRFDWGNIQVLGETAWEEIGASLYEKWFLVSVSQVGEGYLTISKDCTKEGYEEATLPVIVLEPTEEGTWREAYEGVYPFADPTAGIVESAIGEAVFVEGTLLIGQRAIELPLDPIGLDGELGQVRVFYMGTSEDTAVPLLMVSETFFLRFDHLVSDAS